MFLFRFCFFLCKDSWGFDFQEFFWCWFFFHFVCCIVFIEVCPLFDLLFSVLWVLRLLVVEISGFVRLSLFFVRTSFWSFFCCIQLGLLTLCICVFFGWFTEFGSFRIYFFEITFSKGVRFLGGKKFIQKEWKKELQPILVSLIAGSSLRIFFLFLSTIQV